MSIMIEIWGDAALFTRPEMKTERVSYDVITPSAARGILEAIYWHPGIKWIIDKIYVRAPIQFMNIRRNEVKSVISARKIKKVMDSGKGELFISTSDDIQQRAALILKDVHYIIEAHFNITCNASDTDNAGKFQSIMKRRVTKGQCYHQPYFGVREFPVNYQICEQIPPCPEELLGKRDLGYMLWDMDYTDTQNIKPLFFRAILEEGVITVPDYESGEVIG